MYTYLDKIASPADVKQLNMKQLETLCDEMRDFLIESVSNTGGHLSSNLGTIELTTALHYVFQTPQDSIVFDVGHQCYTHKLLTGRKEKFEKLRQLGGLSGFPAPKESEHDVFIAGHGNTAISAAIGIANAKKLRGEPGKVIAIVGDGAFTGGMVYEGMNNICMLNNLIVILNDNTMSISKNVGSVAQYLTQLRTSPHYFAAKRSVESFLNAIPMMGAVVKKGLQTVKSSVRQLLYHSTMFEEMGFQYVGPVDGHDVSALCTLFSAYRDDQSAPLFVHAVTVKGKGFTPAEENPGEFHGVSAFDLNNLTDPDIAPDSSFSTVFGKHLAALGEENKEICAVTAAMKYGTGLQYFYRQHKPRFFDVGMAEQHAVTFAAGLAAGGMHPVVCIYSTFLQRSYDQVIHDVNLQDLSVLLAIDRAGFVPGDGETHQGIYDAAFLSQLTGVVLVSPCNYEELRYWTVQLLKQTGPRAIRYPRGGESEALAALGCTGAQYDVYAANASGSIELPALEKVAKQTQATAQKKPEKAAKTAIVTYGGETAVVLEAVAILREQHRAPDVYKLCQIHPLPQGLALRLLSYEKIVFAEEGVKSGGIGEHLAAALQELGYRGTYKHIAAESRGLTHATVPELRTLFGLDATGILQQLCGKEYKA